ncbi:hypothetical protein IAT38_007567 [Cryptococcus sp. DSM 104549]
MSTLAPFEASALEFTPLPSDYTVPAGYEQYGRYMLTVPWTRTEGWGVPKIAKRENISLEPLAAVLQYSVTCFEGMKCYKTENGDLRLFRPNKNSERLKRSAGRLCLPADWDNADFVELLAKLVALEAPMVPNTDGSNLYLRPTLLETSPGSALRGNDTEAALLYVVTQLNSGTELYPSADSEEKAIKLGACKEYIRAWPGGTGSYKLGANYGPGMIANKPGYAMNLWLHGKEDFISEAGGMNVFVIIEAPDGYLEFTTMSLSDGIVLPGITRESIIELLKDHAASPSNSPLQGMPEKIRVVERDISMGEILERLEDGTLKGAGSMFGCGTGVVVVQIGEIFYEEKARKIPTTPLIKVVRDTVTGIQRGRVDEGKGWSYKVPQWNGQ